MSLELDASPEELRATFSALQTREDVAVLLDVKDKRLIYHLYIAPDSIRYKTFAIPKKSGGHREISAPISALKIIQQKLNQVLYSVYTPKPSVYGFVHDRDIRKNAKVHARRRYVLNIDLKDFFPSINFGRVRGMFMGNPYYRNAEVATVLAQICCFNNQLPQGAPTSPIVSNMICAKLDANLQQLAKRYRCTYTRYADDITFSTTQTEFPRALAYLSENGKIEVGDELQRIISSNHFEINPEKVRLQTRNRRQEVTGLTVNKFPNVRRQYIHQIRGMLHAWRKYGLESAQKHYLQKYNKKYRSPGRPPPLFERVVQGKIEFLGMVRGKHNPIYLRLREQLYDLKPELRGEGAKSALDESLPKPLIITEGKTDWKHLKAAFLRLKNLGAVTCPEIEFQEEESAEGTGNDQLLTRCKALAAVKQARPPTIFIFDRDVEQIKKKASGEAGDYKKWGNRVYSFVLPTPEHRKDTPDISIEFFYKDEDIRRKDLNGRRLFLSNEFNPETGRHLSEDLNCPYPKKDWHLKVKIIEDKVFDKSDKNFALPKNDFADYILNGADGFNDVDFSAFAKIFDFISTIVADDYTEND